MVNNSSASKHYLYYSTVPFHKETIDSSFACISGLANQVISFWLFLYSTYSTYGIHTVRNTAHAGKAQVMSAFYILSNFLSLFVSIGCYTVISNLNDTVWLNIMFKMFLKVLLRILIRLDPNKFTRTALLTVLFGSGSCPDYKFLQKRIN